MDIIKPSDAEALLNKLEPDFDETARVQINAAIEVALASKQESVRMNFENNIECKRFFKLIRDAGYAPTMPPVTRGSDKAYLMFSLRPQTPVEPPARANGGLPWDKKDSKDIAIGVLVLTTCLAVLYALNA